jgi:hypothetical protein
MAPPDDRPVRGGAAPAPDSGVLADIESLIPAVASHRGLEIQGQFATQKCQCTYIKHERCATQRAAPYPRYPGGLGEVAGWSTAYTRREPP